MMLLGDVEGVEWVQGWEIEIEIDVAWHGVFSARMLL